MANSKPAKDVLIEDDDDVPPLEDMSDLIQQVNEIREIKHGARLEAADSSKVCPAANSPRTVTEATAAVPVASKKESSETNTSSVSSAKPNTFGGFKKGFLFSSKPTAVKSVKPKASVDNKAGDAKQAEIPLIKPKDPQAVQKSREIPEVQEAMKASMPLLDNQDWITEDLMQKIQKNPALTKQLMDPRMTQALARMQSDPKAAWDMLDGDPEMQKLLKEFSGILGEHFNKLGDKETKEKKVSAQQSEGIGLVERSTNRTQDTTSGSLAASPEDEERMRQILQDPQTVEILADPRIQQLIADLRSNPASVQETMKNASAEMRSKIRKLVDVGLLAFA